MHVLDDPGISARLSAFLTGHAKRLAPTSAERIRRAAIAYGPDGGELGAVPEELIAAAVAFEERFGGFEYRFRPGDNPMEYGLDGSACFRWTAYGWSMPALLDGSWTATVDVLPDGRTVMVLGGSWPDRVIDRTVEQRLESHALRAEVADWPHFTMAYETALGTPPPLRVAGLPDVPAATGPANHWWYDGDAAVQWELIAWPPDADRWQVRCFALSERRLARVIDGVSPAGPISEWCSICGRFLRPDLPGYAAQGTSGHCAPAVR